MDVRVLLTSLLISQLLIPLGALGAESLRTKSLSALDWVVNTQGASRVLGAISDLPPSGKWSVGAPLELHLTIQQPAYVNLLYVDSHGVLELVAPDLGNAGNFATAGDYFVPGDAAKPWTARPPSGPASLFILTTTVSPKAIDHLYSAASRRAFVSAADAPKVLASLGNEISGMDRQNYSIQKIELLIYDGGTRYSTSDIVRYFNETTRSISKPRLDAYVNFSFNSADIQPSSNDVLDTWGKALKDPSMTHHHFVIGGHTDDVGTNEYNDKLSMRRAEAVRSYLVKKYGIESVRLQAHGYGKTQPLSAGSDEATRYLNRRVDFERAGD